MYGLGYTYIYLFIVVKYDTVSLLLPLLW